MLFSVVSESELAPNINGGAIPPLPLSSNLILVSRSSEALTSVPGGGGLGFLRRGDFSGVGVLMSGEKVCIVLPGVHRGVVGGRFT